MTESGESPKPPGKLVQAFSLAVVVLRHRRWRRNLIFGVTLLTLFLVFAGITILGDRLLEKSPVAYLFFWGICFVLVMVVLGLALLDLIIIRKEHCHRVSSLEQQMADAARDAREKMDAEEKAEAESGREESDADRTG